MALTKLTLSVDEQVVTWAREISGQEGTSISSMFSRYVMARKHLKKDQNANSPLTREALQIGREIREKLPDDFDDKKMLTEILAEKYGIRR